MGYPNPFQSMNLILILEYTCPMRPDTGGKSDTLNIKEVLLIAKHKPTQERDNPSTCRVIIKVDGTQLNIASNIANGYHSKYIPLHAFLEDPSKKGYSNRKICKIDRTALPHAYSSGAWKLGEIHGVFNIRNLRRLADHILKQSNEPHAFQTQGRMRHYNLRRTSGMFEATMFRVPAKIAPSLERRVRNQNWDALVRTTEGDAPFAHFAEVFTEKGIPFFHTTSCSRELFNIIVHCPTFKVVYASSLGEHKYG